MRFQAQLFGAGANFPVPDLATVAPIKPRRAPFRNQGWAALHRRRRAGSARRWRHGHAHDFSFLGAMAAERGVRFAAMLSCFCVFHCVHCVVTVSKRGAKHSTAILSLAWLSTAAFAHRRAALLYGWEGRVGFAHALEGRAGPGLAARAAAAVFVGGAHVNAIVDSCGAPFHARLVIWRHRGAVARRSAAAFHVAVCGVLATECQAVPAPLDVHADLFGHRAFPLLLYVADIEGALVLGVIAALPTRPGAVVAEVHLHAALARRLGAAARQHAGDAARPGAAVVALTVLASDLPPAMHHLAVEGRVQLRVASAFRSRHANQLGLAAVASGAGSDAVPTTAVARVAGALAPGVTLRPKRRDHVWI